MTKVMSKENMIKKIESGLWYITYYSDLDQYELSKDSVKSGYVGGVKLTEQRAKEWLDLGAELLEM